MDNGQDPSLLADLAPVLIGGGITLLGTFLVQVFVIPRVQAGTRRIERWEKDVVQLMAILDEELPRVLKGYKFAGSLPLFMEGFRQNPHFDQDKLTEGMQKAKREAQEANQAVGEQMSRLASLVGRIKLLRRDAPYWRRLDMRWTLLHMNLIIVQGAEDEAAWDREWERIDKARKGLVDLLHEVAIPMKPPSRRLVLRARRAAVRYVRKAWRRWLSLALTFVVVLLLPTGS